MILIKTYVGSDGMLHFVNSAGADSVLPFSPNKNGPCVYILTASSTAQKTVTFTAASAGTVQYEYIGESSPGAFTTISRNGVVEIHGTQGSTEYDYGSGSYGINKGDVISATGYLGAPSGGMHCYFLVLRCVYT